MRTLRTGGLVLAVILLVSACGRAASTESPGALAPANQAATVQVTNNNWSTMVVYLLRSGMRVRLGMVQSMNTAEFRIPSTILRAATAIRLVADPIGSPNPLVTHELQVNPGQQVHFNIENNLPVSSVTVWE